MPKHPYYQPKNRIRKFSIPVTALNGEMWQLLEIEAATIDLALEIVKQQERFIIHYDTVTLHNARHENEDYI